MIAAVTGASGHLGTNLVQLLVKEGWHVRGVMRGDCSHIEHQNVQICKGDIRNRPFLNETFLGVDAVFHLAGILPLQERDDAVVWDINVNGTLAVLESCVFAKVKRLVHCSSIHAYQDMGREVNDEYSPLVTAANAPTYDRSKAEAQRCVMAAAKNGLNSVIVAPTGVMGPGDEKESSLGEVVKKLLSKKMPALIAGGIDWVDVRDVAIGMLLAHNVGISGDAYILGGSYKTISDFAQGVCEAGNVPPPKWECPMFMAKLFAPLGDVWGRITQENVPFTRESVRALSTHQRVKIDKAVTALGYAPRDFFVTVGDMVEWYLGRKG